MFAFYVLLLLLFGVYIGEKIFYNIDEAKDLFDAFIISHNRSYANEAEKNERFNIFKDNLAEANQLNEMYPDGIYGINQFADLTNEEFLKAYAGLAPEDPGGWCRELTDSDLNFQVPAAHDWREHIKIAIKHQQSCMSCWAFAATGSVEAAYHLKYKTFISLSEQQLVDCNGRSCQVGGLPTQALRYLIRVGGQEPDSVYPYRGIFQRCQFDRSYVKVRLADCRSFNLRNEELIKQAVYKYGPLTAAVDATSFSRYNGGIMRNCRKGQLNHAVMIVGYGTDTASGTDYWIVKNSYGTSFGENGYARIPRGQNACNILNRHLGVPFVA